MTADKSFKFIIEHMEPSISEWVELEYKNMISHVGEGNLILSGLEPSLLASKESTFSKAILTEKSVDELENVPMERVILLDPKATVELSPAAALNFDYLLFRGILGDGKLL